MNRIVLVIAALAATTPALWGAPGLRVAAFQADATPDMGEPNIWTQPVTTVLDPLLAKGIVLDDGARRYVIAAIDWCGVGSSIHLMLRSRMAAAAGADVDRVALQSVHQHTAPYVDGDAYKLLATTHPTLLRMSPAYLEKLGARLEESVREAVAKLSPFDRVGTGRARVERVGSARRILKDGKILVRYSSTAKTPELAAEPEGDIDPDIRTITFALGGKPLVRLHYYASHPQTFCCDGRVTADFVGDARARAEKLDGVPQIYFDGCGGNVTVGKYNTGQDAERLQLADRLFDGMRRSIAATRYKAVKSLAWKEEGLRLPAPSKLPDVAAAEGDQPAYRAALAVAFAHRETPLPTSALHIGKVVILHLPGEPLLEFQRYAQRVGAGRFVAVAGYGDISPGYLCPDEVFRQGGYEPGASNAAPGTEARLKETIRKLLQADKP